MIEDKQKQKLSIEEKSKKNTYKFNLCGFNNRQIFITSNFDSGNIELIKQISQFHYRLAAVSDFVSINKPKKTWFYFKIRAPRYTRIKLIIQNVDILLPIYQSQNNTYKSVVKVGDNGQWKKVSDCYLSYREQLEICIDYTFQSEQNVFFALAIPFTYYDNHEFLNSISQKIPEEIYFNKQLLTYSANQLLVHLLTITQNQNNQTSIFQQKFNNKLFPDNNRPIRFNKPIVFITCRVHPGQVTASHTLVGMIKFLLNSQDLRAYLLRKFFVFNIVPMVNPDGVYQGNYRMDTFNNNLNRLYINPSYQQQPSVYGIKCLTQYLNSDQRVQFYFDMHGHSSKKGAFIYGNAFDNLINQVESQVFCKILSINSRFFSYEACNFSQKHMNIKDKNQPLSKQGCSRVVIGRLTGIIHCLTLQTGLYFIQKNTILPEAQNLQFTYHQKGYTNMKQDNFEYLEIFEQIGQGVLITILDVIQKNPYSRIKNSDFQSLQNIRKSLGPIIFQQEERFKMLDLKAYQKSKMTAKLIKQTFIDRINKKWNYILHDKQFVNANWPIEGLKIFKELEFQQKQTKKLKKKKNSINLNINQNKIPEFFIHSKKKQSIEQLVIQDKKNINYPQQQFIKFAESPLPKVIYRMTLKLDNSVTQFIKKSNFSKNKSTRKLLRDFKNEKIKHQNNFRNIKQDKKSFKDQFQNLEKLKNTVTALQHCDLISYTQSRKKNKDINVWHKSSLKNSDRIRLRTQNSNQNGISSPVRNSGKNLNNNTQPNQSQNFTKTQHFFQNKQLTNQQCIIINNREISSKNKREMLSTKFYDLKRVQKNILTKLPEIIKLKKAERVDYQEAFTKQLLIQSIKLNKTINQYSKVKL